MCHLDNHLEKSIIILVITMFLTIPNMHMYSFVGGYQTFSPALTANASESFSTKKEQLINLPAVACLITVAAALSVFIGIATATDAIINLAVSDIEVIGAKEPLLFNADEHYEKHDFSKFDN